MKKILLAFLLTFFFIINSASAEELLMIYNPKCHFCIAFMNEIGESGYAETEVSSYLPLHILDTSIPAPLWIVRAYKAGNLKPIDGTPIFILWDEKNMKELDRITGYRDKAWFFNELEQMLSRNGLNNI